MKKFIIPAIAASAFMLYSCSTTQLASQADSDDVYNTTATARVIQPRVAPAQTADDIATSDDRTYRTDEQLYGGGNYTDRDYEDNYRYGYASRINRFYYNSPWRTYYDYYGSNYYPWYSYQYDPFFYDPWAYRPGLWVGINSFPRGIFGYNYGYYGYSGYGYMGPYSYYNTYPGYRYGYGNGGYFGGYNASNPRPNRGGNDAYRPINRGTIITGGQARTSTNSSGNRVNRDNNQPSSTNTRPRPNDPNSQSSRREAGTTSSTRPAQTERPARVQREAPPARTTRETYTPPPSDNSGSSRSSGGNSGSSGGSNSGGGRPSRGGR